MCKVQHVEAGHIAVVQLPSSPMSLSLSTALSVDMPAKRNPRGKYKYLEETLNELHSCKYCSKQFKIQGLQRHEDSCRKHIENEQQEVACNIELEISMYSLL